MWSRQQRCPPRGDLELHESDTVTRNLGSYLPHPWSRTSATPRPLESAMLSISAGAKKLHLHQGDLQQSAGAPRPFIHHSRTFPRHPLFVSEEGAVVSCEQHRDVVFGSCGRGHFAQLHAQFSCCAHVNPHSVETCTIAPTFGHSTHHTTPHHHLMCSPPFRPTQRHHTPLLTPFLSSGPNRISSKRTIPHIPSSPT